MFTRHGHSLTDKLDCPHAIRTNTLPPQRAKSFHHILLLPSASLVRYLRKPSNLRVSLGASAAQVQAIGLWLCRHAGACPPGAQRTATGYPGRCTEVIEARISTTLDWRCRHFWQKRYYDFNVRNHAQFVEKLRYIHRNPVKRGLCERPEEWPWSSFCHYATGAVGRVEIESDWTARKRERAAGRLCPAVELPHSSQRQA